MNEVKKLNTFSKRKLLFKCYKERFETMNVAFNKIDAIVLFNRNEIDYFKELLEGSHTNFEEKLICYCNATDNEKEVLKEALELNKDFVTTLLSTPELLSRINSNQISITSDACEYYTELYDTIIGYPKDWCKLDLSQQIEIIKNPSNLENKELIQLLLVSNEPNIFKSLLLYLKSKEYNSAKELSSEKLIQLGFNADALENHTNFLLNNDFPFYTKGFMEHFNKLATTNNTEVQKTKEILLEEHSKAGLLQNAIIKNKSNENKSTDNEVTKKEATIQVIGNHDLFNNITDFVFPNIKTVNSKDEPSTEEIIRTRGINRNH